MNIRIPARTHLERLKLCAIHLSMQRGLRRSGWGSVGWGAFTLAIGLYSRSHAAVNVISMVLGTFLLIEGAWVLRAAAVDPVVLRWEAAALLLLGLWNTVGLYLEIRAGLRPPFGLQIIFAGLVQLVSAYTAYRSFPVYQRIYEHLDRACLHELETKIGNMWKQKDIEPGLVEFKLKDQKCRARFLPDTIIFLTDGARRVIIADRSETKVGKSGNKILSKMLKVDLTLEDETLKTEMKEDCYQEFKNWVGQAIAQKVTV